MASLKPQPLPNDGHASHAWSNEVMIDPNIFFGTAKVTAVNTAWNRLRTPTNDVTSVRQGFTGFSRHLSSSSNGSVKGKWNKSLIRIGSVNSFSPVAPLTRRRESLLIDKVARASRQNSLDRCSDDAPFSPTSPSATARRFSTLSKVNQFINKVTLKGKSSSHSDLRDLSGLDRFRVAVKTVQMERKLSDATGGQRGQIVTDFGGRIDPGGRRTVSFGDVTMGALHKTAEKKKLARLHKWSIQENKKRQLMSKFRLAAKIIIFCHRLARDHTGQNQDNTEFSTFMKIDFRGEYEPADLLFDPSRYKANKQTRISEEFIRIMSLEPEQRTQQEIYYVQIATRNIPIFQDFPARMQRKIAERGMYESYDAKRLLVRQGHPASAYYFILSGSVAVMVLKEGAAFAESVAYLSKGQTFGELAIIKRSHRASSIITRETSQFLSISVGDYHNIFMCGGVKTMNDPDHDEFLQSLTFLKGWPLNLLSETSNKCLFLYFKRGDVLVKDSQYSDWLIVVKSGSVAVLKKLKKVQAYEWRAQKGVKFVSEKEKREKQIKRSVWKKMVLPELNVPLKGHVEGQESDDIEGIFDANGDAIPFTHPDMTQPEVSSVGSSRKIWNFGTRDSKKHKAVHERDDVHHVQLPHITVTQTVTNPAQLQQASGSNTKQADNNTTGKAHNSTQTHTNLQVNQHQNGNSIEDISFKSEIRTINSDLDSGFHRKDPDDITPADLNPEFVHVQTLTKGRVFGLSDLILGQQTSFCVVSNGADCLLISKQMFAEHIPEALHRQLRMDLCPYPSEEELQASYQISVDWHAFKEDTLMKTLHTVSRRKHRPMLPTDRNTVTPI